MFSSLGKRKICENDGCKVANRATFWGILCFVYKVKNNLISKGYSLGGEQMVYFTQNTIQNKTEFGEDICMLHLYSKIFKKKLD